ncbi:MAG: RES family NAD+ phosphorylase [Sulfitobacter sp.]
MTSFSGRFWRIVLADRASTVLHGVQSPEGRLHHSGQSALYVSPSPEWAAIAIDAYVSKDDPPRVLIELDVSGAHVTDLRDSSVCAELGITVETASVPWQPERKAGRPATSWQASDAVRATGSDGLIYPARSDPSRWHMVLHRWNGPVGPTIRQVGASIPWLNPR